MTKVNKWQRKDWKRRRIVDRTSEMRTRLLSVLNEFEGKSVSSKELLKLVGDIDLNSVKGVGSKVINSKENKDNMKLVKSSSVLKDSKSSKVGNQSDSINSKDLNGLDDISVLLNRLVSLFPRDASAVRVKNRCVATGTANSVMRKFRMSRFRVREMAMDGMRPGYRKASW